MSRSPIPKPWILSHCIECWDEYPESGLLVYGDHRVCIGCKDVMVDKMKQGLPIGRGPWTGAKRQIVIDRNHGLPPVCMKCGCDSSYIVPVDLKWARDFRMTKRAIVQMPLCSRHFDMRRRLLWVRIATFPLVIVSIVLGIVFLIVGSGVVFYVGCFLIGVAIVGAIVGDKVKNSDLVATRIDDSHIDVKSQHKRYRQIWPSFVESARIKK